MAKKKYAIAPNDIIDLVGEYGYCIASDQITVMGEPVGYMYREKPDDEYDSGWRFYSGYETDDFLDKVENFALHDVNSLANFDSSIIPFLDSPTDTAFERNEEGNGFTEVPFEPEE